MILKRIYLLSEEGGGGGAAGGDGGGGATSGGNVATTGSDVAGFTAPLLLGASKFKNKRDKRKNSPKIGFIKFLNNSDWRPQAVLKEYYDNDLVRGFDAKLTSIENKSKRDRNSEAFALEDLSGNIVKVYVERSQARDFKAEISSMLEDEYGNRNDIAEILFSLKNKYTIYDISWPKEAIPKDEEEENSGDMEATDDLNDDSEGGGEDEDEFDLPDELDGGGLDGTEAEAANLLSQFIELMKKDIEAKEAEAKSRQAEAEARIAERAESIAMKSAEKTEQILDMEEFERREKQTKEEEDINKRLIKYRRAIEQDRIGDDKMTKKIRTKLDEALEEEPSYEEILDMEAWEEEERKKKERENLEKRLLKFRRAKKKQEEEALRQVEEEEERLGVDDFRGVTLGDFIRSREQ